MSSKTVSWVTCTDNVWCTLSKVNLSNVTQVGVYVIWQRDKDGAVVKVGQGNIKDRLTAHRNDSSITKYGELSVTWAVVDRQDLDGVERYLGNRYSPIVAQRFPDVPPIAVNLPGK